MWQRPTSFDDDDPFTSPAQEVTPSTTYSWEGRVRRPSRFSVPRFTPFIAYPCNRYCSAVSRLDPLSGVTGDGKFASPETTGIYNTTTVPYAAFQPPESGPYRIPDIIDTFHSYKFRDTCNVSSLDLHAPFGPLCRDRASMLMAMSSGGRIGHDAPYMPRGCDMRWFTSEEVCEILGRFDRVLLVGDSMLRHLIGSINILIRRDLGHGAVTDWNFLTQERKECFCNEQFDIKACSVQGIYKTADVFANDPDSLSCVNPINVMSTLTSLAYQVVTDAHAVEQILRFPIPTEEIIRLKASIGIEHDKPKAVIFGHGLWSNLDLQKTVNWLDAVLEAINPSVPILLRGIGPRFPDRRFLFSNEKSDLVGRAIKVRVEIIREAVQVLHVIIM
ncbi:hypothetical protein LARI1_G007312, partial [Lachnellula arida]